MIMSVQNKKSSVKKKNVTLGVVHIQATFNNTIVTFTDIYGNVISAASAGQQYNGAKKSTPYAAQITVDRASSVAAEHGMRTLSIKIKGAGNQREAALRAVMNQDFIVTSITDVSPVPHNGCRAPKRRRV
jgi:small subunit ribosomal protein S11